MLRALLTLSETPVSLRQAQDGQAAHDCLRCGLSNPGRPPLSQGGSRHNPSRLLSHRTACLALSATLGEPLTRQTSCLSRRQRPVSSPGAEPGCRETVPGLLGPEAAGSRRASVQSSGVRAAQVQTLPLPTSGRWAKSLHRSKPPYLHLSNGATAGRAPAPRGCGEGQTGGVLRAPSKELAGAHPSPQPSQLALELGLRAPGPEPRRRRSQHPAASRAVWLASCAPPLRARPVGVPVLRA